MNLPANIEVHPKAYFYGARDLARFRSRAPVALKLGRGSSIDGTCLDVGPNGRIVIGEFTYVSASCIVCDTTIEIGDNVLIAWNAVLIDNYGTHGDRRAAPIKIATGAWIGFEACILPGVTVGEGAVVSARSVVTKDVPPYSVVFGNPARIVKKLTPPA
ncbi:MAG: acyltransferase [Elusimicrobia bacterium]|nr:acyltransferase [Elusimicrobiota bacterium]